MFTRHVGDTVCSGSWCGSVEDLARIGAAVSSGQVFRDPARMSGLMLRTRSSDGQFACGWGPQATPFGGESLGKGGLADGFSSVLSMGYGPYSIAAVSDCGGWLPDIEVRGVIEQPDALRLLAAQPDQWRNVPGTRYEPFR